MNLAMINFDINIYHTKFNFTLNQRQITNLPTTEFQSTTRMNMFRDLLKLESSSFLHNELSSFFKYSNITTKTMHQEIGFWSSNAFCWFCSLSWFLVLSHLICYLYLLLFSTPTSGYLDFDMILEDDSSWCLCFYFPFWYFLISHNTFKGIREVMWLSKAKNFKYFYI